MSLNKGATGTVEVTWDLELGDDWSVADYTEKMESEGVPFIVEVYPHIMAAYRKTAKRQGARKAEAGITKWLHDAAGFQADDWEWV